MKAIQWVVVSNLKSQKTIKISVTSSKYRYLAQNISSIDQILGLSNKLQIKQSSLGRELDLITIPSTEKERRQFSPSDRLVELKDVGLQRLPGFYLYRATPGSNILLHCCRNWGAFKLFFDEHLLRLWSWTPSLVPKADQILRPSKENQFMINISLRPGFTLW